MTYERWFSNWECIARANVRTRRHDSKLGKISRSSQLYKLVSHTSNQPSFPPLNISPLIQQFQKLVHPMRLAATQHSQETAAEKPHGAHDDTRGGAPWAAGSSGLLRGLLGRHWWCGVRATTAKVGRLGIMRGIGHSVMFWHGASLDRDARLSHVWRARGFRGSDVRGRQKFTSRNVCFYSNLFSVYFRCILGSAVRDLDIQFACDFSVHPHIPRLLPATRNTVQHHDSTTNRNYNSPSSPPHHRPPCRPPKQSSPPTSGTP